MRFWICIIVLGGLIFMTDAPLSYAILTFGIITIAASISMGVRLITFKRRKQYYPVDPIEHYRIKEDK